MSKLFARLWDQLTARLWPGRVSARERALLVALVHGAHLKAHRTLDGDKSYRLHRADGSILETVAPADVERLRHAGLIVGNMKFPAATYLLTPAGLALAQRHSPDAQRPLTPRG